MKCNLIVSVFIVVLFISGSLNLTAQDLISWDPPMEVASRGFGTSRPRIVHDGQGWPVLIWGKSKNVVLSRWDGMKFIKPIQLNPDSIGIASANWMGPNIAAKGDTIYVVYKQVPESSPESHIWCLRSLDGGVSFSDPSQVDFLKNEFSRFPTVTIDNEGNPIVGFMKFNEHFEESKWVISKSRDLGVTFIKDIQASNLEGPSTEACECCPGTIVANNNSIAMLYRNNEGNLRDNWVNISNDLGDSFEDGINIDQQEWEIFSCPASGPDAVIIQDSLYAVFMNGASGLSRVYFNKLSLNVSESAKSQLLTEDIEGLIDQNFPRVSTFGNAMAIVWEQNVKGIKELPILFSSNIKESPIEKYEVFASSRVSNADVSITDSKVFVVW